MGNANSTTDGTNRNRRDAACSLKVRRLHEEMRTLMEKIEFRSRNETQGDIDETRKRASTPEKKEDTPTEHGHLHDGHGGVKGASSSPIRLEAFREKIEYQRELEVPAQQSPSEEVDGEISDEDHQRVLHVRGIPSGVEAKLILLHFSRKKNGGCGDVEKVILPKNDTGNAFVYFADATTVARVLRLDHILNGDKVTVEVPTSRKGATGNGKKVEEDEEVQHEVECGICYGLHPLDKVFSSATCGCHMCEDCASTGFTVMIKDKDVRKWRCPVCSKPEENSEMFEPFCYMLSLQLPRLLEKHTKNLFDQKLNEWSLMKSPNFRWCAHCQCGFEWDPADSKRMKCHKCKGYTCFDCKEKWLIQHDGETCERFAQWKKDNDPDEQAKALDDYLQKHGIECPACKFRFDLARGGCLHFTCKKCDYVFCGSCKQQFRNDEIRGLHCQHLQDCLEGMRDRGVGELQSLLQHKRVKFDRDRPAGQRTCPVVLQDGETLADRLCGKDTLAREAGFCTQHYKEYLIDLIRKNKINPSELPSSSLSSDSSSNSAIGLRNIRFNPYAV